MLSVIALLAAASTSRAQSVGDVDDAPKRDPAIAELPMIGWHDIVNADLPGPKPRMRKPKDKALIAFEKKLAKQREPAIKLLLGRDFMGLCEVVSAVPNRRQVKTMQILLQPRKSIEHGTKVGPLFENHRWMLFQIRLVVDKEQAKELPVGTTLNLNGVVESVEIVDWQILFNPFGDAREDVDMIVRVTLKDFDY